MPNVESTLLYKWFEKVWNQDNENAIDELMTHDSEAMGIIADDQPKGAAGFKIFFKDFRSQFHDVKITVEDVVSEADLEAARTTVNAVHTASGKEVSFTGMCMARISNGKIGQAWNNYDFLNLYQQIGQKLTDA